ncbi:histidine kinase [Halonotius sp. GCM10025705]|uniref:histidine kinase n=1 Tax=Halonotius sp. GCM10025705 TaxID=3252678 RepID=UPI003615F5ED
MINLTDDAAHLQLQILEDVFDTESVRVGTRNLTEGQRNLICLIEDGEVVATSPWGELTEAFLQVNSDRYKTGTKSIKRETFPDVLTGLDEIEFTVRGYPASNNEKLLLILISRFIEFQALSHGSGEFDVSFQYLSRLDDEFGTQQIYKWLGESEIETHVYGIRDDPSVVNELDAQIHADHAPELSNLWFVVFQPPASPQSTASVDPVALVAEETGSNVWRGLWTYDPDRVQQIKSYVRQTF